MSSSRTVRIASGSGFWGDLPRAPIDQARRGPIDYLVLDYLAEVTMSILRKQRRRAPDTGYAADFVDIVRELLPDLMEGKFKILANAGGVNPEGCAGAILAAAREAGVTGLKVGVVTGDDLLDDLDAVLASGAELRHMETGLPIVEVQDRLVAANAYTGAPAVAEALAGGAHVVVTGRVADPSLTLAALQHEFGWAWDDWDRMAAGTVAGHLLECGAQASGGNFTDWQYVPNFADIGFPICEVDASGDFTVTKHDGTGGLVSRATVAEQLVYEIGDPENYPSPDVVVDFTSLALRDLGGDQVRVTGVTGKPATEPLQGLRELRRRLQGHQHARLLVARRRREGAPRRRDPRQTARHARPPLRRLPRRDHRRRRALGARNGSRRPRRARRGDAPRLGAQPEPRGRGALRPGSRPAYPHRSRRRHGLRRRPRQAELRPRLLARPRAQESARAEDGGAGVVSERRKGVVVEGETTLVYNSLSKLLLTVPGALIFVAFGPMLLALASDYWMEGDPGRAALMMLMGLGSFWFGLDGLANTLTSMRSSEPHIIFSPAGFTVQGRDWGLVRWDDVGTIKEVTGRKQRKWLHIHLNDSGIVPLSAAQQLLGSVVRTKRVSPLELDETGLPINLDELRSLFDVYLATHRGASGE